MNAPLPKTAQSCGCGGGSAGGCSCGGAGCAACNGQVYVRPRFFAGQLLTEDDLQTLTDYVANKNRLHNRHLMGTGVVCGLEVTCDPCGGGSVVVHPGHALDCCGNDIVLQCAVTLDVNAMIRDLRRDLLGGYDCGDPCAGKARPVIPTGKLWAGRNPDLKPEEDPRQYCLYVRYCEELTDPVTPYASDEPCGQATCEPARVREGLRFELRCNEEKKPPDNLLLHWMECFGDPTGADRLASKLADLEGPGAATAEKLAEVKEALLVRLDRTPGLTDCALRNYVRRIALPDAGNTDVEVARKLQHAALRYVRDCFCRAINPACPPCDDPGVLLACIEVQDCEVIDICNLERSFVLTAVAFRYWFPVFLFGDSLEATCCEALPEPEETKVVPPQVGSPERIPTSLGLADAGAPSSTGDAQGDTTGKSEATLSTMLTERLLPRALKSAGLSMRDALAFKSIFGSMQKMASAGTFDSIFPVRDAARAIGAARKPPAAAEKQPPSGDDLREVIRKEVEERVGKTPGPSGAKELRSLKRKFDKLEKKYEELAAKLEKGGGPK